MNLPNGVTHHPRQKNLITQNGGGLIRIERSQTGNADYQINNRAFEKAIAPYLHGDWEDFDRLFRLDAKRAFYNRQENREEFSEVIYSGAEHRGTRKFPNITVVPNLSTKEARGLAAPLNVFGCTMGHYHEGEPLEHRIQEVYEFQSYGLLALDKENGEIELWVAKDGDKVAVPNRCHMTLYNLGGKDEPLITLDFAHPDNNPSNKDLIRRCGPVLLAYYDDFEAVFQLNHLYINNPEHKAGVRLGNPSTDERERQVRIPVGARLDLGRYLYEQLTKNLKLSGQFARLGIRLCTASTEAVLEPARVYFSLPLVEATKQGTTVYRYFFPNSEEGKPGEPRAQRTLNGRRVKIKLAELDSPPQIVVEGAGEWVENTFRPLFKNKVKEGFSLSVYYVDDTRWKGRPEWADQLQDWETYLDKANPVDFERYEKLRPNVVFVVTPDFLHSEVAKRWLDLVPLIFVEKPFDSNLDNVNGLVMELGVRQSKTLVRGLDHYRSYAVPIRDILGKVEDHLDECLREVVFYMTEDWPLETGRVRTLQYGLTLDLLPHFIALLPYFGDVRTIDEIRVIQAGKYRPLVTIDKPPDDSNRHQPLEQFRNEMASSVEFTFQDYSGNGYHVPCRAIVGKGFKQEVKYLEVTGKNGNAIRIDFGKKPDPGTGYKKDRIFFLQNPDVPLPAGARVLEVPDLYDNQRTLYIREDLGWKPLDRDRYDKLIDDILNGTEEKVTGIIGTFSLANARQIVDALDRIWDAIQDARPDWDEYDLGSLLPVKWGA